MAEKWWAVLGLLACLGVWAGMALGPVRLARLQRRASRVQASLRAGLQRLGRRLRSGARHTAHRPQQARDAQQEAADAINRARRGPRVNREGNVYRPDAFNNGKSSGSESGSDRDKGNGSDKGSDKLH